ncbi:MAG TPA: lactate racemase domain-containing protein [Levilinea sp.]|nr:lactate racemase domain-containing protein [Levilinea sp.]
MTTFLSESQIAARVQAHLDSLPLDGSRVLVIIPDSTRTFPHARFYRLIVHSLHARVSQLNFLVALGTHPYLTQERLLALVGLDVPDPAVGLFNHTWADPHALAQIGEIPAEDVAGLTGGLQEQAISVHINRMALEHDHLLVCGPVFPHEIAGFSGGNKYFFPGISSGEIIERTHWLGAQLTSSAVIGVRDTPVRALIDRAAALIPTPRSALCAVTTPEGVVDVFAGSPEEAFLQAVDLSRQVHICYVEQPFRQVLSVLPEMYDELWVGGKGMYKLEPVVSDGGELILYAPHIKTISATHGKWIEQVGYHTIEYFTCQWARFEHVPLGVLAHSTNLKGPGTYRAGLERSRINVTLATGIPEDTCRALNLGYRDPASIDPATFAGREHESVLLVAHAGETLYRLRSESTQDANPGALPAGNQVLL